jgi:dipeptidyl aminopeptidase/acylaminoacyl peptidase
MGARIAYRRSERQQFQIWVMNVDGSDRRRLTSGGDGEFGPQWSPDGRRLAYMVWDDSGCTPTSGSGCAVPDVWTVDADGSGQRKILDSAFQPRWSPDGSKLLFQRYEANSDLATLGVYLARATGPARDSSFERRCGGPHEPLRRGRPPESSSRTTPATSCTSPASTGARRNSSRRVPPVRAEAVAESHRRSGLATAGACTTGAEITFRRVP